MSKRKRAWRLTLWIERNQNGKLKPGWSLDRLAFIPKPKRDKLIDRNAPDDYPVSVLTPKKADDHA